MNKLRVLIVASSKGLTRRLAKGAEDLGDVLIETADSLVAARKALETILLDVAVVDLAIESDRGIDLLLGIRHSNPDLSLLAVTDPDMRGHDMEAIKLGVDGFVVQPVRAPHVSFQLARIRELRRLRMENRRLTEHPAGTGTFEDFVGTSGEMQRVYSLISRAARTTVPVAIYGRSGTGKELTASAIHRRSSRAGGPFVIVNPASIPETLLESEMFGHVRGAFTGAASERVGYIEAANGGTLFLDEIGELPSGLQAKLLRVLQHRIVQRLGSSRAVPVDFRLITATNRDLMAEVRAGRFREDLFYRIHVFPIYLPALSSRPGDLPLLCEHFLRKACAEHGRRVAGFGPGVFERLAAHSWPGNVRELENMIRRVVAMKDEDSLIEIGDLGGLVESLPDAGASGKGPPSLAIEPLRDHERKYVRWAYERLGRNKARTARLLEIDRVTLYRKLQGGPTAGT